MHTVNNAGYLEKDMFVISYITYKKEGSRNKACHLLRTSKEVPKYAKLAHLITNVCLADLRGVELSSQELVIYRKDILNKVSVVVDMYKNKTLIDSEWFSNAVNQEDLLNALKVFLDDSIPLISKLMASKVARDLPVFDMSNVYVRKSSQLLPIGYLGDLIICECSCGSVLKYHKKLLGMIDRCKKCELDNYQRAMRVITQVEKSNYK